MKKFMMVAVVIGMAFLLAAPAMAVDPQFSGAYRVRGFSQTHFDLQDNASDAYFDMRLRLQSVFKLSDDLSFTFRFDALDGTTYGDPDGDSGTNWDRAFITFNAGVKWMIGRQTGGAFGTTMFDYEGDSDRIKCYIPFGNFTLVPIYQKLTEDDSEKERAGAGHDQADEDYDAYILALVHKAENVKSGLLGVYYRNATVATQLTEVIRLNPYAVANFGDFTIQAEVDYRTGQTEYDAVGAVDLDYELLAYFIEGSYNFGQGSAALGYIFFSGDENGATDNENSAYNYGTGDDWEGIWILTNSSSAYSEVLGPAGGGNLSYTGSPVHGASIFYGSVSYNVSDAVTMGAVLAVATADEVSAGEDDDYGTEIDLKLKWKIMDNLSYNAIAAFLSAGDYWKSGTTYSNIEDTFAFYNKLQVSF